MAIALVKDGIKAKNNYTKKKAMETGVRGGTKSTVIICRAVNVWELENLPQLQLSKFNIWIYN